MDKLELANEENSPGANLTLVLASLAQIISLPFCQARVKLRKISLGQRDVNFVHTPESHFSKFTQNAFLNMHIVQALGQA